MMGIIKARNVFCIIALIANCCRAQPRSSYFDFSSLLQKLGLGAVSRNGNEQSGPSYSIGQQKSTSSSPSGQSQLLSILANRWEGIENQVEERLENQPDHIAEVAESRVEQASDYFDRAQEKQEKQINNNGWNSFISNGWNSYDDNDDNRLDHLDDRVENKIDQIENIQGEQVAEAVGDRWDTVKDRADSADDKMDDYNDDRNNWSDAATDDDDDDDNTYSNDNSWGSFSNIWANIQPTNNWNDDNDDNWSAYEF